MDEAVISLARQSENVIIAQSMTPLQQLKMLKANYRKRQVEKLLQPPRPQLTDAQIEDFYRQLSRLHGEFWHMRF